MKRFAAILLLGMMLFNWFGYQLFTSYMETRSNTRLEANLDSNNYDESQLLVIKVPALHLPYYTNSKSFERVDGQFEIAGVQYKYVKRRLFNDSLELLCIPNQAVMNLQTAKDDFFKLINDLQHTGQGKKSDQHPGSSKSFSIDYFATINSYQFPVLNFILNTGAAHLQTALTSSHSVTPGQPPEMIS